MKARMSIRNIILIVAVIYMASMFFINISFASNTGKVSVETAKLREQANTDCKVLELISQGEEVEILSEENGWYKIKYKKITGYVRQDLVQVENKTENNINENTNNETTEKTNEVSTETNTEQPNNEVQPETTTQEKPQEQSKEENKDEKKEEIVESGKYKIAENVKIKVIPLISSIELDELTKDTKIEVIEILNSWVKVKTSDEKTGWIRKEKISTQKEEKVETTAQTDTKQPETKPQTQPTVTQPKTMYVNSQKVNVRKQPSTSAEVVKQLTLNAKVSVLSTENGWSCVEIDGEKAYISASLLSTTKQETSRGATTTRNQQTTTNTATAQTQTSTTKQPETTTSTNTNTTTPATTTSSKGSEIVAYAKQFLGCRYVYGGTTTNGFDCSGFTQYVYKHFGITINRTAAAQYSNGTSVSKSNLQAGDLVMFGKSGINHVGIYIGGNTFIHAANKSRGVTTDTLASGYYNTNYVGARRIL